MVYIKKTLEKFNIDKSMKYFPGVSIVHNIRSQKLNNLIVDLKNQYLNYDFSEKLIFLPEASYHLTVCDIITYNNKQLNPELVDFPMLNGDDDEIDQFTVSMLGDYYSQLSVTMIVHDFTANTIVLVPKTSQDNEKLRTYRKHVRDQLKLPYDDYYEYHISISYTLLKFNKKDITDFSELRTTLQKTIKPLFDDVLVNVVDLTFFNDMSEFRDYSLGRVNLGTVKPK